jgi:molecular chaperone IbpA
LIVSGQKDDDKKEINFLHKGIATRAFKRKFQLADYVKVKSADYSDGMIHIDIFREVPEELKPRQIEIAVKSTKSPVLEH